MTTLKTFNYKKGDVVPQSIEHYNKKDLTLIFSIDVIVFHKDDKVEVYPVKLMKEDEFYFDCIMLRKDAAIHIIGAPTSFYKYPLNNIENILFKHDDTKNCLTNNCLHKLYQREINA